MKTPAELVQKHARSNQNPPEEYDDIQRTYWEYCQTGVCSSVAADIAFSIHDDETQREILESLLLGKCPPEVISEAFKVPLESVNIYQQLFFNVNWFRTDLEKISYLENYEDNFGRELKRRSLNLGYEYVLYTYANIAPKAPAQKKLVQNMFLTSAYKAMNMNYSSMTSATMRQAVEHGKLMLKAYEALEKINSEDNSDTFNLVEVLHAKDDTYQTYTKLDGELI